ncbi:MAG: hypothetical protein HY876_05810 [Coriobacteriales bacterium]|nr:hypothetical protein [Coriobacteriales bacterium]
MSRGRSGQIPGSRHRRSLWRTLAAFAVIAAAGAHLSVHIILAVIDSAEVGGVGWPLAHLRLAGSTGESLRGNDYPATRVHLAKIHHHDDATLVGFLLLLIGAAVIASLQPSGRAAAVSIPPCIGRAPPARA